MSYVFLAIAFGLAVIADAVIGSASFLNILPPFAAIVFIAYTGKLPFGPRCVAAIVAGFFMDALQIFPFGTYLIMFAALALISEWLAVFFSNTESALVHVLVSVMLIIVCMAGLHPVALLLGY